MPQENKFELPFQCGNIFTKTASSNNFHVYIDNYQTNIFGRFYEFLFSFRMYNWESLWNVVANIIFIMKWDKKHWSRLGNSYFKYNYNVFTREEIKLKDRHESCTRIPHRHVFTQLIKSSCRSFPENVNI